MSKWNRIRDKVLSRSDSLDKQIYNGKLFVEQKASELYKDIEDEKGKIKIISKAEKLSLWSKYINDNKLSFTEDESKKFDKYILNTEKTIKNDDGEDNYKINQYEIFITKEETKNKNILTAEEKIKVFEKYLLDSGYEKIDGDFLLHRFLLKEGFTRVQYNKLKNLSKESLSFILKNDHIQEELQDVFDDLFDSVFLNGKKYTGDDLELLEITEIIEISRTFIGIFDLRFNELKKK